MQSQYPAQFVRDMGCTEHEWLTWLQAALPDHPWQVAAGKYSGHATAAPAAVAAVTGL